MAQMRLLHVIDTTGPGGAETLFVELCKQFNQGEYESLAVLRGPGWVQQQLERAGVRQAVRDCKGSFNIGFLIFLVGLIRKNRIDVVQSHLLGSNVYCALAGLLTGTPVVATFHGSVDIAERERFLAAKFALVKRASAVVSVSEGLRDDLVRRAGIDAGKISLIKNGIDCVRFAIDKHDALKRERNLPADTFLVGALGNIRPAKDYGTAIQALAQVVARDPRVHLIVAGDIKHALHTELLALARELGVSDHVHFLGFYESPEKFLAGLDLYVLSSKTEGHPFSVMQAMAAGLPIVATRCGVETMLDDSTSGLVDVQNPQQLAEAILRLRASPEERQRLGAAARQVAFTGYDLAVTVRKYAALYRKAVALGP